MTGPIHAAIFDLDGTLLDTLEDLANSANHTLRVLELPEHPLSDYKIHVGDGARVLMERILPEGSPDSLIDRALEIYVAAYEERWKSQTRPYEGIPELLDSLVKRGVQLAVLSNKPHAFTVKVIEEFLSAWPWKLVYGMRDGVPKKPDPAGAIQILDELGVSAENCLYFGDTNTDMKTAVGANLHAVGVTWGFRERAELEAAGAQVIIDHPSEILDHL